MRLEVLQSLLCLIPERFDGILRDTEPHRQGACKDGWMAYKRVVTEVVTQLQIYVFVCVHHFSVVVCACDVCDVCDDEGGSPCLGFALRNRSSFHRCTFLTQSRQRPLWHDEHVAGIDPFTQLPETSRALRNAGACAPVKVQDGSGVMISREFPMDLHEYVRVRSAMCQMLLRAGIWKEHERTMLQGST